MLLLYKDKIISKLIEEFPIKDKNLIKIILFGSVAKENYTPESDIDILLVTKFKKKTLEFFLDFKMEILMQYKVIINAMYVTPDEYRKTFEPIYNKIKKEGRILWIKEKIQN
jgi:predicted nucleotidyltransferase